MDDHRMDQAESRRGCEPSPPRLLFLERLGIVVWRREFNFASAGEAHIDVGRHWRAAACSVALALLAILRKRM